MQRRVAAYFVFAFVSVPFQAATAATLPDIKINPGNTVPECVTPGRMIDYLRSRNPELNPRFEAIASEYMRLGEKLGVRWDFAFYQMILETGALSYRRGNRSGDVRATQNNFAGLGATGGGEPGEAFKDIPTGVRAHLEHLLLYSGEKLDNPVADRTRKVQEWGVLTKWQSRFTKPITFSDLAAQWAPGSGGYARMLDGIAERYQEFCEKPDPRPELATAVRRELRLAEARAERPSGAELARRAIEESKADEPRRSALGAVETASASVAAKSPPMPFKVLNAPPPEADKLVATDKFVADAPAVEMLPRAAADPAPKAEAPVKSKPAASNPPPASPPAATKAATAEKAPAEKQQFKVASAAGAAKPLVEAAPPAGQKCRVWTASYGGQKALIIRSVIDKVVNYTVLDVNEGAEKREADAFISAYAKEGAIAGEYGSQAVALDKAFEMCPEG
jgi:Mannosyl-glycoprotein endo-beta-N-acetylglucosaminidase